MRVCGVADAWIFCGFRGFIRGGGLICERPGVRISFCAHGNARMRHASMASRGYWGYWGYFSQVLEITRLFERPHRGYFGGYFRGRGFPRARYHCVCAAPVDSIRCGEPLLPRLRTQAEFGLVGTPSVVPTNDANRFRFGKGSEFPNRCHLWAFSMQAERKPDRTPFPLKNAKKRHLRRHTRNDGIHTQDCSPPWGSGASGGIRGTRGESGVIDGLARLICAHEDYSLP